MTRIIIIGAGFAGLSAIKTIRKLSKTTKITLISPKAEFIYLPSLIWIPSGLAKEKDIRIPLNIFLKRMDVLHIGDEVIGFQDDGRTVVTKRNSYQNDAVIICSGGKFIKNLPGIEHTITPCEGLSAANKIKEKLKKLTSGNIAIGFSGNPKEPSAMRGGPMFEFLFAIDTQLKQEKRRDKFNLIFFTPAEKPGARLGDKAVAGLLNEMKKRNIKTHLGHKIISFSENKVITADGEITADMILFMPGMTGNDWFKNSNLELSDGGLIVADKFCQTSAKNVFVAGDAGSFPGPDWMPKQAHMADLQSIAASKNAYNLLNNKAASHSFKVELICIIDSLNKGILVKRTEKTQQILPNCRIFHLLKKLFAWWYLRNYR